MCCVLFSRSVLSDSVTPWTRARQAPLSMGFSSQEYWSGLQFPSPGGLSNPGVEPGVSCTAGGFFTTESPVHMGFPDSSVGEESAYSQCRRPGLIPGSGRSAGEGIGYPLQYSWASLLDQLVKNLPAMQETWVQSLGWEDHLEKGKATQSSILAWRIPCTV